MPTPNRYRAPAKACAWCSKPPLTQEIAPGGYYIGACRTHGPLLKPYTAVRIGVVSADRYATFVGRTR